MVHTNKKNQPRLPRITCIRGKSYLIELNDEFSCVCDCSLRPCRLYPPWPTQLNLMQGWWEPFEAPAGLVEYLLKYSQHLPRDPEWYGYGDEEFMREHGWYVPFPARPAGDVKFPGWGDKNEDAF